MKAVLLFKETDMRRGHLGLGKTMKEIAGKDPTSLKPGEVALFFNRKTDAAKYYAANGVIGHAKFNGGVSLQKLDRFAKAVSNKSEIRFTQEVKLEIIDALNTKEELKFDANYTRSNGRKVQPNTSRQKQQYQQDTKIPKTLPIRADRTRTQK